MLMLKRETVGDVQRILLDGELNADTIPELEGVLEPLCKGAGPKVILDLTMLRNISCAGVGCFICIVKRCREKGGDLRFTGTASRVRRVFFTSGN